MSPPDISIIVPIRNESAFIARCLTSLQNQTLARERFEILVVDGRSSDNTRELVTQFMATDKQIQLLDNPGQTAPYAMNIGLAAARGQVIVRVDGHCELDSDYLVLALEILEQTGAGCVGGPLRNIGETYWARAIALGMSSPFGVGNALFRYAEQASEVDTLAFGAYKREVFETVGAFNQELTRNQDDEYNYRVREAGFKIWLDPRLHSRYYTRGSLKSLWKQYYQYGFWKIRVLELHPGSLQLRHLIPALFWLGLIIGVLAALFFSPWGSLLLLSVILPYLLGDLLFAWRQSQQQRQYFSALLLVFPTLHLSYGAGFWMALFRRLFGFKKTK